MLLLGALEMFEVLLQRRLVELREELRLGGEVVLADVFDQLTLAHGALPFVFEELKSAPRALLWRPKRVT